MDLDKRLYISKSFACVGSSLSFCFDCKYCRLIPDKEMLWDYNTLPSEVNEVFTYLPVAVNLFYGDPFLQVDNTVEILHRLEAANHKGPVIIITKGDFRIFPDIGFDLDLHIAFSTFGLSTGIKGKVDLSEAFTKDLYNGSTFNKFLSNIREALNRSNKYKYSIEFRPIIYKVNDTEDSIQSVLNAAHIASMPVGYSGLQGKPSMVDYWRKNKIPFYPYPGFKFGHKKSLSSTVESLIKQRAADLNVPVFRKTSCLIAYVHNLDRDYNAHYYRPNEVGCLGCSMMPKCSKSKQLRDSLSIATSMIPFKHDVIYKQNHTCILKRNNICEFPSDDCSKISGGLIKIYEKITTADVRVIKWLTGYTVDADFVESPYLSREWSM